MNNAGHIYGTTTHLYGPSPFLANRSTCPSAPTLQAEVSENGHSTLVDTSSGSPLSAPFQETRTSPGSLPLMSHNNSQSNPFQFMDFHLSGHGWPSEPLSQDLSPGTPLVLRSQMIPGYSERSTSPTRRTSLPTPPTISSASQSASGPPHTRHNNFRGQHAMHPHLTPYQNQSSQSYVYHGYHLLESNPYPPARYYPLPLHPFLPYFRDEASVEGGHASFQRTHRALPPMPQSATNIPTPHATSFGVQQYLSPPYGPPSYFGLGQQYQHMHQWYHDSGSPSHIFPMQAQQRYSFHYPQPQFHSLCGYPNVLGVQSTGLEHLPSSGMGPGNSSFVTNPSRDTISPSTANASEQTPVQGSPKVDAHELSHRLAVSTSHAHDRPSVRRHYHPNPPSNRSEWVMWVGNVPSDATHDELWSFLKSSAPVSSSEDSTGVEDSGVLSLFLISRSNCAFVNYHSEQQLDYAITQFNGRQLRPNDRRCPKLVCRARRKEDDLRAGVGGQRGMGVHTQHVRNLSKKDAQAVGDRTTLSKGRRSNVVKGNQPPIRLTSRDEDILEVVALGEASPLAPTHSSSSYASTTSSLLMHHFPKRFFILKSLTQYDLDLSVERGIWATQKHNEAILDQAFRTSKEVILIFSVNKSGEFYGYARMASGIIRSNQSVSWAPRADSSPGVSSPSSRGFPLHGALEQPADPTRRSPEIHPLLPESPLADATPFPLAPPSDERKGSSTTPGTSQVKSSRERRSAPPVFVGASDDPLGVQSSLQSNQNRKGWSWDTGPYSAPLPVSGKHLGVGRSKVDGVDDSSSRLLQPVMEEVRWRSGVEESAQLTSMAALAEALPGPEEIHQGTTNWGETFKVEWLRTERVPFHRTRHVRNPWNHGREIKVARDGTEIEPSVGEQFIDEWPTLASMAAGKSGARSGTADGPLSESKDVQE